MDPFFVRLFLIIFVIVLFLLVGFILLIKVLLWYVCRRIPRVTRWDLFNHTDEAWRSAHQIWQQAHKTKGVELGSANSMPLETALGHLNSFEQWWLLEKKNKTCCWPYGDDELEQLAQSTMYRRRKIRSMIGGWHKPGSRTLVWNP